MKRTYDQIADQYAERYSVMPEILQELGTTLLDHLPDKPTMLDAGCGNGRDMAWFESQGARVTGIDLSAGMLAQARPHVAGHLLEMDMASLSLPDSAFDAVWCMAALLHIPKSSVPDVLSEFRRVLNPNGVLVLGLQEGTSEAWEAGGYESVERYFARYLPADVEGFLTSAGFDMVSLNRHRSSARVWLHVIARPTLLAG
jgi:SAM-dependent methyltransferase